MCSPKRISDSLTTHVEILMPADLNGYNRLFGGRLMQWIDVVAGVVARRHSGCEVTTASVDQLEFQAPAFVNDTIAMEGRITHVGRTSMEVRVDTFVESLGGERRQVNRAYLVMVALDPKTHKPTPVPSLLLETEEDFAEWEAGQSPGQGPQGTQIIGEEKKHGRYLTPGNGAADSAQVYPLGCGSAAADLFR